MKKILFIFLLIGSFAWAQMPNIENVWLNDYKPYTGTIGNTKTPLKLTINISEQNIKNDQEYFLAGFTTVEQTSAKFEGKLTITKYKGGRRRNAVYGDYEFAEEPNGKHSGILKGKFIYTFMWNKRTEKIENQFIEFIGDWTSYDQTLNFKTNLKNQ